jgi:hypothetical protein
MTPSTIVKPAGVFIHAFAVTTNAPDSAPLSRHDHAGRQMRAWWNAIPRVEVDAEEDRFGEEREPFERERHADDAARMLHEGGPEQPEFERQYRAGDSAHGKHDRGALGPPLGELLEQRISRAQIAPLGGGHERRHADADHGEDDVKAERHRHLAARGEQVRHDPAVAWRRVSVVDSPAATPRWGAAHRAARGKGAPVVPTLCSGTNGQAPGHVPDRARPRLRGG